MRALVIHAPRETVHKPIVSQSRLLQKCNEERKRKVSLPFSSFNSLYIPRVAQIALIGVYTLYILQRCRTRGGQRDFLLAHRKWFRRLPSLPQSVRRASSAYFTIKFSAISLVHAESAESASMTLAFSCRAYI